MGVPVGPGVAPDDRCHKPIRKYIDRASELSRSPLCLAAVVRHVQVYATPVLTYAAMTSA